MLLPSDTILRVDIADGKRQLELTLEKGELGQYLIACASFQSWLEEVLFIVY